MKLSTSLLSAIIAGLSLQAVSCSKDKEITHPKVEKQEKKTNQQPVAGNCPACGMG